VGNSLEVIEAIETLKGKGPFDITELSLVLAGVMIYAGGKTDSMEAGRKMAEEALNNGSALAKFKVFVTGQGGDPNIIDDYGLFPQAEFKKDITAKSGGYVGGICARTVGFASQHSGAGRAAKDDLIDMSAGIYMHKKVGDKIAAGDILATVYGNDLAKVEIAAAELLKAFHISGTKPETPELIKKIIV